MKDLAKKKLGQFSKRLEAAQAAFGLQIAKLAEQARAEILPYFKEHNLDYMAGNGTWIITKPSADSSPFYRPEDCVEDEELPENIRALLNLEVGVNDYLGFYIEDIRRVKSAA